MAKKHRIRMISWLMGMRRVIKGVIKDIENMWDANTKKLLSARNLFTFHLLQLIILDVKDNVKAIPIRIVIRRKIVGSSDCTKRLGTIKATYNNPQRIV